MWMDQWGNEYYYDYIDGDICSKCLTDAGLLAYWKTLPQSSDKCTFCGKRRKSRSARSIQKLIMKKFEMFYIDSDNAGGYFDNCEYPYEFLDGFLGGCVSDEFYNEILESFDDFGKWSYGYFGDEPRDEILQMGWSTYCKAIKTGDHSDYVKIERLEPQHYPNSNSFLSALSFLIEDCGLFSTLKKGSSILRGRTFDPEKESPDTTTSIGTPDPKYITSDNRFSKKHEPAFYGCWSSDLIQKEIGLDWTKLKKENNLFVVGAFVTDRDLIVVDFTRMQFPKGLFDHTLLELYHVSKFMEFFLSEIRKPAPKNKKNHKEYRPTQSICTLIRTRNTFCNHPVIDGIIYNSCYNGEKSCVLFFDHIDMKNETPLSLVGHWIINNPTASLSLTQHIRQI